MPKTRQELFEAVQKLPRAEQELLLAEVEKARAEAKTKIVARIRETDKPAAAWQDVLAAYRTGDQAKLNAAVKAYREQIDPASLRRRPEPGPVRGVP